MKLRLGFCIAIHAQPDILLLDEVMTMGDEKFQRKNNQFKQKMFKNGVTLIIVTQFLNYFKNRCNKIILFVKRII
jgi:ABC-type polysaccharide/polyol phosphate transport system ATPase subunit